MHHFLALEELEALRAQNLRNMREPINYPKRCAERVARDQATRGRRVREPHGWVVNQ
jgi:hypothetical protein